MADRLPSRTVEKTTSPTATKTLSTPSTGVPPKRPLTKPLAPRTSTLTKPTATSATRASPATTLSKPPTRPTISATKKPASAAATSTPSHLKRASLSSVEASDDKKKDGISARPKRVSLAPSSAVTSSRATGATLARTPISSTTGASRLSATSRSAVPSTPRSLPLASTAQRNVVAPTKARLSTIPASPVVHADVKSIDENKLNTEESILEEPDNGDPIAESSLQEATAPELLNPHIVELENQLAESHTLEEDLRKQLADVTSNHENTISDLRADSDAKISELENELDLLRGNEVQLKELDNQLAEARARNEQLQLDFESVQAKAEAELSEHRTTSQSDVEALRTLVEELKTKSLTADRERQNAVMESEAREAHLHAPMSLHNSRPSKWIMRNM
jgi:hypothetical protein